MLQFCYTNKAYIGDLKKINFCLVRLRIVIRLILSMGSFILQNNSLLPLEAAYLKLLVKNMKKSSATFRDDLLEMSCQSKSIFAISLKKVYHMECLHFFVDFAHIYVFITESYLTIVKTTSIWIIKSWYSRRVVTTTKEVRGHINRNIDDDSSTSPNICLFYMIDSQISLLEHLQPYINKGHGQTDLLFKNTKKKNELGIKCFKLGFRYLKSRFS